MIRRYRRDGAPYRSAEPKTIEVRFASHCADCGQGVAQGARALWQPGTRAIYGEACGCAKRRQETIEAARIEEIGQEFDELANETMHAL
jgi:hypothetical protein